MIWSEMLRKLSQWSHSNWHLLHPHLRVHWCLYDVWMMVMCRVRTPDRRIISTCSCPTVEISSVTLWSAWCGYLPMMDPAFLGLCLHWSKFQQNRVSHHGWHLICAQHMLRFMAMSDDAQKHDFLQLCAAWRLSLITYIEIDLQTPKSLSLCIVPWITASARS